MKQNNEIKTIKKYRRKQILLLSVLLLFSTSILVSFGRYAIKRINNSFTRTKEFYFYSDKLSKDGADYQILNWSGVDDYTITVNLNSNANNLLKASYDLDYEINCTCSSNLICELSKTSGTISANTNSDFFNINITPNAQFRTGDTAEVEITVEVNEPYHSVLSGKFTFVVGQESLTYQIDDSVGSTYLELSITNTISFYNVETAFETYSVGDKISEEVYSTLSDENKAKCYSSIVTLSFDPNILRLDMTDENYLKTIAVNDTTIGGKTYINGMTFKIPASSSTKVRFYKLIPSNNYTYPIVNSSPIITLTNR